MPVKLYDLDLPDENEVTNEMLPEVTIQVLLGTRRFVASLKGELCSKCSDLNPYSAKKKMYLKMSSAEVVCCK